MQFLPVVLCRSIHLLALFVLNICYEFTLCLIRRKAEWLVQTVALTGWGLFLSISHDHTDLKLDASRDRAVYVVHRPVRSTCISFHGAAAGLTLVFWLQGSFDLRPCCRVLGAL